MRALLRTHKISWNHAPPWATRAATNRRLQSHDAPRARFETAAISRTSPGNRVRLRHREHLLVFSRVLHALRGTSGNGIFRDQLTQLRIDQGCYAHLDLPSELVAETRGIGQLYSLSRGWAMKSRDTASTCSWLACWLLMVFGYISVSSWFRSRVISRRRCHCRLQGTAEDNCFAALRERDRQIRRCCCAGSRARAARWTRARLNIEDGTRIERNTRAELEIRCARKVREELFGRTCASCESRQTVRWVTMRRMRLMGPRESEREGWRTREARAITWLGLGESWNLRFVGELRGTGEFGARRWSLLN